MINPPVISLVTATIDTISINLTAPVDPTFDHAVVIVYDAVDGDVVATIDPATSPTTTTGTLLQNRTYLLVAYSVDDTAAVSAPSETVVVATTNYIAPSIPVADLTITDVYQTGFGESARVIIEYSLVKGDPALTPLLGDLVVWEYSKNGTFTDSAVMTPDFANPLHELPYDQAFVPIALAIPPQHRFVWDITRDIPDHEIHEYVVGLQGRLVGSNTPFRAAAIDVDRSDIKRVVGTVVSGQALNYSIFLWNNGSPLAGAILTVSTILDSDGNDRLGGAVVLPDGAVAGQYDGAILIDVAWPTGLYQINYTATDTGFSVASTEYFFVISTSTLSLSSLTDVNKCLIYGTLYDVEGNVLPDVDVVAGYKKEPSRYDKVGLLTVKATTDSNGFFILPLLRGADVVLMIAALEYSQIIKVPDALVSEFRVTQVNQPSLLQRGPFGHSLPQT